jgi:hypothetical protein
MTSAQAGWRDRVYLDDYWYEAPYPYAYVRPRPRVVYRERWRAPVIYDRYGRALTVEPYAGAYEEEVPAGSGPYGDETLVYEEPAPRAPAPRTKSRSTKPRLAAPKAQPGPPPVPPARPKLAAADPEAPHDDGPVAALPSPEPDASALPAAGSPAAAPPAPAAGPAAPTTAMAAAKPLPGPADAPDQSPALPVPRPNLEGMDFAPPPLLSPRPLGLDRR